MRRTVSTLLSFTALFAATTWLPGAYAAEQSDAATAVGSTYQLLNLFGDVFERVKEDYVEDVKDGDLVEAAINGMLTSLDPHSSYMNEKAFREMQVQTRGEFGGLGIEVTMESGLVKVVSPIDDTPAFRAGVQPGDLISHIDDEAVMGMSLNEAVEKMRGPVDSKVKITILREDEPEPLEVNITRAVIKIRSVRSRQEGDIGYIRINSFNEQTSELLQSELETLKKDIPNLRGLVLDLRNNPGGLLDQAVFVSDAFLKQGEIVSTRERDPSKTKRYSASEGNELAGDLPIVVLINHGSASASEIVAGALQDHKRAVVLGTQSFGKGSVQTVIPLSGHGAMRLTTSRYYTPSGTSIQAKGITPDIIVEQARIELIKTEKVKHEADLRRRLQAIDDKKSEKKPENGKQPNDKDKKNGKPDEKRSEPEANGKENGKEKKPGAKDEADGAEDFQLQRALDLLRAIDIYHQIAPAS